MGPRIAGQSKIDSSSRQRLVLVCFFLSGASGLICEIVWVRLLSLTFGHTVWAVSTVLVAFMGGLAAGGLVLGRLIERKGYGTLRTYALLELGIAAFALLSPAALWVAQHVYLAAYRTVDGPTAVLMALRFVSSLAVLFPPTFLMGATLPTLAKCFSTGPAGTRVSLPRLYAANTLGAVVGCFGATFAMLGALGVHRSLWAAACLNICAAFGALAARRRETVCERSAQRLEPAREFAEGRPGRRFVLAALALGGFCSLSYETLWARMIVYVVGADVQAFGMMLGILLLGFAVGGAMCRVPQSWERAVASLGLMHAAIAAASALTVPLFPALSRGAVLLGLCGGLPVTASGSTKFLQCLITLLPPALVMGASFPMAASLYAWGGRAAARDVGRGYAANTGGAIVGTLCAGFVLIPSLGIRPGVFLTAGVNLGVAVLCLAHVRGPSLRRLYTLVAIAGLIASLCWLVARRSTPGVFDAVSESEFRLAYYDEGVSTTLSVLVNRRDGRLMQLNSNGIPMAFTNHASLRTQKMLAHVPMLLHPNPRRALVIGLGSGTTAGAVRLHGARTDVVEIEKGQREAARWFAEQNRGVLDDQDCRVIVEDGRTLLAAARRRYDVIVQTRMRPRSSHDLFSADHYWLCRRALRPRGLVCVCLPVDLCPDEARFRELIATFRQAFPHCTLWYVGPRTCLVIGTVLPFRIDASDWTRRAAQGSIRDDLEGIHIPDGLDLLAQFVAGPAALRQYVQSIAPATDEKPLGFRWPPRHLPRRNALRLTDSLTALRGRPIDFVASPLDGRSRAQLSQSLQVARLNMRARALLRAGSSVEAARVCSESLRQMPRHPEVRYQYARALHGQARTTFRSGDMDATVALLRRAISLNPKFAEAHVALGEALDLQGRRAEAITAFKRALQIAPEFDYARARLEALHRSP